MSTFCYHRHARLFDHHMHASIIALVIACLAPSLGHADDPPTTPAGLFATAYSATAGAIAWQRSSDDRGGIVGYEVIRDGDTL